MQLMCLEGESNWSFRVKPSALEAPAAKLCHLSQDFKKEMSHDEKQIRDLIDVATS